MIEVHPIEDYELCCSLYAAAGLECGDDCFGVAAYDGPQRLGHCLFSLNEKGVTVFAVEPQNDLPLTDGILRSALFVASARGVTDAFYTETAPEALFQALDFILDAETRRLNIAKLTEGCACGQ